MIDTLRFARRMEQAGMPREHAEAIAEGFAKEAGEDLATRRDLDVLYWKIMAGVAVLLLAHLAVVWGIVAAVAGKGH